MLVDVGVGGGGGGAARQENFILPSDLGPVTLLHGSKVEVLLEVLHLVGELVGPGGTRGQVRPPHTEDQTGAGPE